MLFYQWCIVKRPRHIYLAASADQDMQNLDRLPIHFPQLRASATSAIAEMSQFVNVMVSFNSQLPLNIDRDSLTMASEINHSVGSSVMMGKIFSRHENEKCFTGNKQFYFHIFGSTATKWQSDFRKKSYGFTGDPDRHNESRRLNRRDMESNNGANILHRWIMISACYLFAVDVFRVSGHRI